MVALVADQTGYPPELLDLDLDLEADLGIDTVKQAELFPGAPELRHRTRRVLEVARLPDPQPRHRLHPRPHAGRRGGRAVAPPAVVSVRYCPHRPPDEDVAARVVALVADQTGYPPELLDLDLDLEADLGIDTVKQAELFAQVRRA